MIERIKDTVNGNCLKVTLKVDADLFDNAKKESALIIKHFKPEGDAPVDLFSKVITEDERNEFVLAKDELAFFLAMTFKNYGLDRNDLVPIDNRDIYHYSAIAGDKTLGLEVVVGGDVEITYYLVDTGKAGQNILTLIDSKMKAFSIYYVCAKIMERMNTPELAQIFNEKSFNELAVMEQNMFYIL